MEEEETETKEKHKGKMVYATFFGHVQSFRSWRRLNKFMSLPRHCSPPFTLCFGSSCGLFSFFLCSALLLRHGRNDSWIGVQLQLSLLSLTNIGGTRKSTKLEGWWRWAEGLLLAHISSRAVFWHERNKPEIKTWSGCKPWECLRGNCWWILFHTSIWQLPCWTIFS